MTSFDQQGAADEDDSAPGGGADRGAATRYSGWAVAGFVCSLVVCCPLLSPVAALILCPIGLGATSGGRRRGRGLAVAGLLVAILIALPIDLAAGYWLQRSFVSFNELFITIQKLPASEGESLETVAADLYARGTAGFREDLTPEALTRWLADKFAGRGNVQRIERPAGAREDGKIRLRWRVHFEQSSIDLGLVLVPDLADWRARLLIDDLWLDGLSARQSLAHAPPAGEPAP